MSAPDPEHLATAYHEAGHYLVAYLLRERAPNVRVTDLSIEGDSSSAGRLVLGFDAVGAPENDPPFGFPPAVTADLERALVWIHLAGREAQWLGTGHRPQRGHLDDWIESRIRTVRQLHPEIELREVAETIDDAVQRSDWETARDILHELSTRFDDVKQRLHAERRDVRDLIQAHRPALEALTAALLERGRLTCAEADEVLETTD